MIGRFIRRGGFVGIMVSDGNPVIPGSATESIKIVQRPAGRYRAPWSVKCGGKLPCGCCCHDEHVYSEA